MAEAFGLSVTAWAPMGAGILTGKYTRGASTSPEDSRRAAGNQPRLSERNLQIAREVDRIADELDLTSAQVAIAWVRQRDRRLIPIAGVRTLEQLQDILGGLDVALSAKHRSSLDQASQLELGFPYELLRGPQGQLVTAISSRRSTCHRQRRTGGGRTPRAGNDWKATVASPMG